VSRRLADIHPCQAVHVKNAKTQAKSDASPGGSGCTTRRFLGRNPETTKNNLQGVGFSCNGT